MRETKSQFSSRLRSWETVKVPVYDREGKIIASVSRLLTSSSAAKAVGAEAVQWTMRPIPGWQVKS